MSKRTIPITIELPVEAAELLVEHGPAIIKALSDLVGRARAQHVEIDTPEVRAARLAERREFLTRLGRFAYRIVRAKFRNLAGRRLKGRARHSQERLFVQEAASELGQDRHVVELAFDDFKRRIRRKIRDRRKREVARLYFQGRTNGEIAARLRMPINTVVRDISDFRHRRREGCQ